MRGVGCIAAWRHGSTTDCSQRCANVIRHNSVLLSTKLTPGQFKEQQQARNASLFSFLFCARNTRRTHPVPGYHELLFRVELRTIAAYGSTKNPLKPDTTALLFCSWAEYGNGRSCCSEGGNSRTSGCCPNRLLLRCSQVRMRQICTANSK